MPASGAERQRKYYQKNKELIKAKASLAQRWLEWYDNHQEQEQERARLNYQKKKAECNPPVRRED